MNNLHCVKSVRIRSFSGLYFPAFELSTDQKNGHGHFSRSVSRLLLLCMFLWVKILAKVLPKIFEPKLMQNCAE